MGRFICQFSPKSFGRYKDSKTPANNSSRAGADQEKCGACGDRSLLAVQNPIQSDDIVDPVKIVERFIRITLKNSLTQLL